MRTTVRIEDSLLIEGKKFAAESNTTLTAIIEEALREKLARRLSRKRRARVNLPTVGGNGLQPGVDLDNSAALQDLMEGRDGFG
ncbi:MAG: DUF2191 domain-containing protein [bacterium]|nr:DUF2191 domain-containing protein [bacterium]